jgi:hypothetical protein
MQINSKSGIMRKRDLIFTGMASGASVGFLISLNSFFEIGFGSFGGFLAYVFGSILLSAFGVKIISQKIGCCEPSLKHLIPVSFLTFFMPVLGPAFGGNGHYDYVAFVTGFGVIGGAFWSLPYVLWALIKKTDSSENEEE